MTTQYGIRCKIEKFISAAIVYIVLGTPALYFLYFMYCESGGKPFMEDIWRYATSIF